MLRAVATIAQVDRLAVTVILRPGVLAVTFPPMGDRVTDEGNFPATLLGERQLLRVPRLPPVFPIAIGW